MSANDEDDDFFADIYGSKSDSKPTEPVVNHQAPASTPAPGPPTSSGTPTSAASANQTANPSDPRAALLAGASSASANANASTGAWSAPSAPSTSAPSAAPASANASDPTSFAANTTAANSSTTPTTVSNPAVSSTPSFDPAAFAKQLQQLQQLQQSSVAVAANNTNSANNTNAANNPNSAPNAPMPPMPAGFPPQPSTARAMGHTEEGYHAGNIFIPAKDEGKMFIGGLNWETTDESMKNYFSAFGEVLDVNVMRDPNTGRSRGFGFLTFKDAVSVAEVLKREHFLDGKIIDPKRAIPREEQDKTAKIFVGGVGMDVTEEDFKNFFETFGTVIDAQLMIDKDTGRPRGFGFVTFDDHAAVDKIVEEKFLDLKGKSIEVKRAEPRLSREWQARNQAYRPMGGMGAMMNPMAAASGMPMGGMAQPNTFYPNAMDPSMMTQYYQQWQTYMSQMQGMMQSGSNSPATGSASPSQEPEPTDPRRSAESYDDRDPRRDRRRADDRRRSRSPPGGRRRRGGAFARDPRDRNYRRN